MKKRITALLIMLFIIVPAYSQKNKTETKAQPGPEGTAAPAKSETTDKTTRDDHVYYEITIEDFENSNYTDKDIKYFIRRSDEKASIISRDQFPAPIKTSKKYLGVKLFGKKGNALQIIPPKKLLIDKYCRSISVWVYGKRLAGELSMLIKDSMGITHRIVFGTLTFLGWRKLTAKLTRKVAQEDEYLHQKKQLQIMKILYKPLTGTRRPRWHYFYIDDISVMAREKYQDRQSDEW